MVLFIFQLPKSHRQERLREDLLIKQLFKQNPEQQKLDLEETDMTIIKRSTKMTVLSTNVIKLRRKLFILEKRINNLN